MGKKRWTTPEQRTWLEELIPAFVQAQQDKTVRLFLTDTSEKWNHEWPIPTLTAEEVQRAKGNPERILAKKRKEMENVRTHNQALPR
jgi:hypothetical protein